MSGRFDPMCGHVHLGRDCVPELCLGINPLTPRGVCFRNLKKGVRHYYSRTVPIPSPLDPKGREVWCVLHPGLVQHCKSTNLPQLLQAVQLTAMSVASLVLLLLLSSPLQSLELLLLLSRLVIDVVCKALSSTLNLIQ